MKSIAQAFRNALTSLNGLNVLSLLGGMVSVGILFAASETVTFVLSRSQSAITTNTLSQARRLTGIGALLAAAGVSPCQFLEDGSAPLALIPIRERFYGFSLRSAVPLVGSAERMA